MTTPAVRPLPAPFLTAAHHEFAAQITRTLELPLAEVQQRFEGGQVSEDEAAREFVTALARDGLLDRAVLTDVRSLCVARETVATFDGFADNQLVLQGLGSHAIRLAGSAELRERYLQPAARGEKIAAFALTEPEAGSDAKAIRTTARRDGDAYVLNGSKTLITNAGIADFYVVFAVLGADAGEVAVVVEADTPGFEVSERMRVMAPHPIGTLRFADCRVPATQCLGEPGRGLELAFATLERFRPSVGAAALGLASRALGESRRHLHARQQFGRPLARFQMLRGQLADQLVDLELARLAVYRAAWLQDEQPDSPYATAASSLAKLAATEACGRIVDGAVQVHGGRGVVQGEVVERLFREARALRIYEGTSEIQRLILAREFLDGAWGGAG